MRGLPLLGTLRVLRTPQLIADPSDFPDKLFPLCVHTYSACRNRVYVVRACNLNIPSGRDATNIHHAPSKGFAPSNDLSRLGDAIFTVITLPLLRLANYSVCMWSGRASLAEHPLLFPSQAKPANNLVANI